MTKIKPAAFRLDEEMLHVLDKLARELHISKTAVIQDAIKEKAWREGHRRDAWKLQLLKIRDSYSPDGPYFILPTVTISGDPGVAGVAHYVEIEKRQDGWYARVKDMPCEATGATREGVEANLLEAVRAHIGRNLADHLTDEQRQSDAA